jgi:hypothetical protein
MTIDISEAKLARNEFTLWLGWTAATIAGDAPAYCRCTVDRPQTCCWLIIIPLWAGLLVGILQLTVLRSFLTHRLDWVIHGAGWTLGYALGLVGIQLFNENPFLVLVGYIFFGIVVGLVQWPVMRREIPSAFPWVFASVVGFRAYLARLVVNLIALVVPSSRLSLSSHFRHHRPGRGRNHRPGIGVDGAPAGKFSRSKYKHL